MKYNAMEGFNRKLQAAVGCCHPNLWRFLSVLQREQSLNEVLIKQLAAGHVPAPPKKRYMDCNARIVYASHWTLPTEVLSIT